MKHNLTFLTIVIVFAFYSYGSDLNKEAAAANASNNRNVTQQQTATQTNNDCDFPVDDIGKDLNIKSPVELLGVFENISNTEDHCYGYVLRLWKSDEYVLGFINLYEGSPEPDRTGPVIKGKIDDNGLHFTVWTKQSKAFKNWQQSDVNIFSFKGELFKDKIAGSISLYDCSSQTLYENYDENVELKLTDMWKLQSFDNFEDWNEYYAPDLNILIGF